MMRSRPGSTRSIDGTTRFSARYFGRLPGRSGFSIAKGAALPFVRAEAVRSAPTRWRTRWEGVVKTGPLDIYYHDGRHDGTSRATVEALVTSLGLERVELLQGIFPDATGDRIADRTFRLVNIDVDVYQSASDVFEWAWPRLSPRGVAVFATTGSPGTPALPSPSTSSGPRRISSCC